MRARRSYFKEVVVEKSAVYFASEPRPLIQLSQRRLRGDGSVCYILPEFFRDIRFEEVMFRNSPAILKTKRTGGKVFTWE